MSVSRKLILALLTFSLVTTVLPATARYSVSSYQLSLIPSYQSPVTLLEQGKRLYDAGQFAAAAQLWKQAAEASQQGEKLHNQAISYNYLAIVYQDLGQWEAAQETIALAIALLDAPESNLRQTRDGPFLYAQILNTQGSLQLKMGQAEAALETWQHSETIYRSLKDLTGIVLSQINQAQALQTLGLYRRSRTKLEQVNQDLAALPESLLKARGLASLGVTLRVVGDLERSQLVLSESLAIAKRLNSIPDLVEARFRLGNTAMARQNFEPALALYQQAIDQATNPQTRLKAQLNQLRLLIETQQSEAAAGLIPQIKGNLATLPPSRALVYAQVNLAESLMRLGSQNFQSDSPGIAQLLTRAVQQARELKDSRAESYALGQLGHLYEQNQQWSEALELTQRAIELSQGMRAADITANWYWQQGRILKVQGEVTGVDYHIGAAIAAYDMAVSTLESLGQDLVAVNPEAQFSFREQVEPVYRQLVQLLLQDVDSLPEATRQQHLRRSREVVEGLQVAELENFFREACLSYKRRSIDEIDSTAAVIYPIILDQRLEVILSLPGQPLQHYGIDLSPQARTTVFEDLLKSLHPFFSTSEILPAAQQLYDWLLRPAAADLERQGIKTLVFVLDGFLRNLPMSVLHDGKQYLLERYNIVLSPGLQLLESQPFAVESVNALVGGLAEARQGFPALPGVGQEIEQIAASIPVQVLLNQDFTRSSFQQRAEEMPFSVVHLATHGQFSSKAEDTFLLTWDDRINVKNLDQLLEDRDERESIELLVLSACQTARGDKQAALGLAGMAVRSGARSTLATLWAIQDQSTSQLMAEFYHLLTQPGVTKAEALRQAQLSLLNSSQYQHPYYWSPFVLVGNWL
ncbi:CHAT domain-containing protein [Lyngbya aestuarii]|uniref:CHAT domain-containing protein n=1 Tax=Lyngbya aestuarii TaxID=118322 RepID=UPI00403DAB89